MIETQRARGDDAPRVKVLATPEDPNPYQSLLYRQVTALGATVAYTTGPTRSHSLNLLLAPASLAARRLAGFNVLHIHWVFQFSLPWARRSELARRLMEWWFRQYLRCACALGYRVVWTAHDLLPHGRVFHDDERARLVLLDRCDLVIALSPSTARQLTALGCTDVRVIPLGPYHDPYESPVDRAQARHRLNLQDDAFVVLHIGRIEAYKGADLLLEAAAQLPAESRIAVVIAGSCSDAHYRERLLSLAASAGARARVCLEWIPDGDVAVYLRAADAAAFPFREVSNSSSISLVQSFGLPVIIPNLENLEDVSATGAIRYEPGADRLVDVLAAAADRAVDELASMSAAARAHAASASWEQIGRDTLLAFTDVIDRPPARARAARHH